MTLKIEKVTGQSIDDVAQLFCADKDTNHCWCMWFIIPVKEFHAAGSEGNRARFTELLTHAEQPLGLLAYQDDEPVGWCAAGPRSRYIRALRTPTYQGGGAGDNATVWLTPCFFVRPDMRGRGISKALLEAAIGLAQEYGATAIEGFPNADATEHKSGDTQVGFEQLFASCGFHVIRRPSSGRVVMRREF